MVLFHIKDRVKLEIYTGSKNPNDTKLSIWNEYKTTIRLLIYTKKWRGWKDKIRQAKARRVG